MISVNNLDQPSKRKSSSLEDKAFFVFLTGEYMQIGSVPNVNLVDIPKIKRSPNETCKMLDFISLLSYYGGNIKNRRAIPENYIMSLCPDVGNPYKFLDQDTLLNEDEQMRRFINRTGTPGIFPKLIVGVCKYDQKSPFAKLMSLRLHEGAQVNLRNMKRIFIDLAPMIFDTLDGSNAIVINVPFPCNI